MSILILMGLKYKVFKDAFHLVMKLVAKVIFLFRTKAIDYGN